MEEQKPSESQGDIHGSDFLRIKDQYEKAVLYQHDDPLAALLTARRAAEDICTQLISQKTSHDPHRMTLHGLIGKLKVEKLAPSFIEAPLRTIQSYGNIGAHPLGKESEQITSEYVQPCLYSLFTVVRWFLETYWTKEEASIPFPITDTDAQQAEAFRKTKETAILVMMFIDIVSSTETREGMGEVEFEELRQQKKDLLRTIIEREKRGKIIKDLGDSYLAVFSIPGAAVETALEIQEQLSADFVYQVRIGLDMGQITQETEHGVVKDVFGRQVNRAARIEALCEGGHILVSYSMWDSAKGWLKHREQIQWKKHGSYLLKGIGDPQEVYEPYNTEITEPLLELNGKRVRFEEALTHCKSCGRFVKLTETFKCRTCGTEEICTANCFDASQRQCIECTAKPFEKDHNMSFKIRQLFELQNPQASFDIKVWTEHDQQRGNTRNMLVVPKKEFGKYTLGDKVVAYFESSTDAYVYMINIGPTGDITSIFPNDYSSDNRVKAGKKYTFPDKDALFEWILQEPAGTEIIKVIATKTPVDIDRFLDKQFSKPKTQNIGVRLKTPEPLSPDQWAEASCTLLVQKK